jgi:Trk-type K+ transport system membrane component
MASYADIPALGRGMLVFNMFAGRLEVVTVFVLFTFRWWRLPRRGDGRDAAQGHAPGRTRR